MVKKDKNKCSSMKGIDMFGYQVQFKYKGDESMRKSYLGGFFTIIALSIVLESFLTKFQQVTSDDIKDAKINQYDTLLNLNKTGPVQHSDLQLSILHVIRKAGKGTYKFKELDRYITT